MHEMNENASKIFNPVLQKTILLVDDDEFQDEYRIYEPIIANQILMDSPVEEIRKVAETHESIDLEDMRILDNLWSPALRSSMPRK